MKIIGTGSLSSALKRVVDVFWAIQLVGGPLMIVSRAVHLAVPNLDFWPISLKAMLTNPAGFSLVQGPSGANLDALEAYVSFKSPSRGLVLMEGIYWLLVLALTTGVLFNLRKVLASLTAGLTFTPANARRLRIIAFLSLGGVLVQGAWDLWGHWYVTTMVRFTSGTPHWPFPQFHDLFFALVLFVIAEAARVGAALEEERALTV